MVIFLENISRTNFSGHAGEYLLYHQDILFITLCPTLIPLYDLQRKMCFIASKLVIQIQKRTKLKFFLREKDNIFREKY